jgi:glycosyltransferase involved in cell wall biosynthesis
LFYGHDIHFRRLRREFEISGNPKVKTELIEVEPIERLMWSMSDVVYYPSDDESDFIKNERPDITVRAIPPFLRKSSQLRAAREHVKSVGIPESRQILFVGGFRHRPNVDAMVWFGRDIWPRILSLVPDSRLCIAGSFPPPEVQALAGPAIAVMGFVSEETLGELYSSSQVAIVPLRFGGGVKGKVVEALSHGTPVVSTSVGAQGLSDAERFMEICDTPVDFAAAIVDILQNQTSRMSKVLAGFEFLEETASEAAARKILAMDVDELRARRDDVEHKSSERRGVFADR